MASPKVEAAPKKNKKAQDDADEEADAEDGAPEEEEAEPEEEEFEAEEEDFDAEADLSFGGEGLAATSSPGGMKGRLGLMGTRTIAGLNGLSARYYVLDKVSMGLMFGFATFHHKEPNDDGDFEQTNTVGLLGVGPQFFFWPYQGNRNDVVSADFGVGLRTLLFLGFTGANDDDPADTLRDPVEIDIEIPLTAQLFIGDRVAIAPEFGFAVRIIPGSREPDDNGDFDTNPGTGVGSRLGTDDGPGMGFELGSTSGMFLGLNVGYYFGGKN